MDCDLEQKLLHEVLSYGSVAVAFSGGVDSAVVAKAAQLALGDRAVAVTGVSSSLASGELELAVAVAAAIGIRHEVVETEEFQNAAYIANAPDRCFHCKSQLYTHIAPRLSEWRIDIIANGANVDDLGDYRPGLEAARNFQVRSPLAVCGFHKSDVRELAAHWQLSVWDKPASPCLSSRVAYGEQVTPQRLRMIDLGEQYLRQHGFDEVRVRYHRGDLARLEVSLTAMERIAAPEFRAKLARHFRQLGFRFVTLDLEGFRSGSLNTLVDLTTLREE